MLSPVIARHRSALGGICIHKREDVNHDRQKQRPEYTGGPWYLIGWRRGKDLCVEKIDVPPGEEEESEQSRAEKRREYGSRGPSALDTLPDTWKNQRRE